MRASAPGVADRAPPHDLNLERAVLSALLHPDDHAQALAAASGAGLRAADFYHASHAQLFRRIQDDAGRGPPDVSLLAAGIAGTGPGWLQDRDAVAEWIRENFSDRFAYAANVALYAGRLRELALRRAAIRLGQELIERTYSLNGHDQNGAAQVLSDSLERIQHTRASGSSSPLPVVDGEALLSVQLPAEDALVGAGILAKGEWILLLGDDKVGKSMLALDLACALADDSPGDPSTQATWLGFPVYPGRRVLYLVGEGGERLFAARHRRRTQALSAAARRRLLYHFPHHGKLFDLLEPADFDSLRRAVIEQGIDIVIIDPLVVFFTGDENDAREVKPLAHACMRLKEETDAAILLVHHTRKASVASRRGSMREARGSSVLTGFCDGGIVFDRESEDQADPRRRVTFTLRYSESPQPLVVALDPQSLRFSVDAAGPVGVGRPRDPRLSGQSLREFLRQHGPATTRRVADEFGIGERMARRRLGEARRSGTVVATRKGVGLSPRWGLPEQIPEAECRP